MIKENKIIILGDLHFGIKSFDKDFFENQILFFEHIVEVCKKQNIKTILTLGDIFDNRKYLDIKFIHDIRRRLFDVLKENDLILINILGNHDIYYRDTLEINSNSIFRALYPQNFIVIDKKTKISVFDKVLYFVPWLLHNETITKEELISVNYVFGHFEIKNFEMVKNVFNKDSKLSIENFLGVDRVFSGHFHIKSSKNTIEYVGSPFQTNWGDFNTLKGYYIFDIKKNILNFYENEISKKYIKIIYDESQEKPYLIEGFKETLKFDYEEFKQNLKILKNNNIKFIINVSEKHLYNDAIHLMKFNDLEFTLIDNIDIKKHLVEFSEITENSLKIEENCKSAIELLIEYFDTNDSDLKNEFLELIHGEK